MELNTLQILNQSYREHPAFQFGPCWENPSKELLDNFTKEYAKLSDSAYKMSTDALEQSLRNLNEIVSAIFSSLEIQTNDIYELQFLKELQNSVITLIHSQVSFFKSKNKVIINDEDKLKSNYHFNINNSSRASIGQLSKDTVDKIFEISTPHISKFRENASKNLTKREDLSINSGQEINAIKKLLNQEFDSLGVLDELSRYIGSRIEVYGVALELSVPQATWWRHEYVESIKAPKTLYIHLDETIECPKAIVYLTKVSALNGPTSYFPSIYEELKLHPLQEIIGRIVANVGSHFHSPLHDLYKKPYHQSMCAEQFRKHYMKLPEILRFNSHLGWDILAGSDIENHFVSAEKYMIGDEGTFIVFDGAKLFHRGGLVKEGQRIALQVIFSTINCQTNANALNPSIYSLLKRKIISFFPSALKIFLKKFFKKKFSNLKIEPKDRINKLSDFMPEILCIDVGASYYPHTAWSLFLSSSNTKWVAVEPNDKNLTYLNQWNHPSKAFKVPSGLSRHGGVQTLFITNIDSGSSLLEPVIDSSTAHRLANTNYFFPCKTTQIHTVSLRDVIHNFTINNPIFVKLDTQGTELDILKGAEIYFSNNQIIGIELESTLQSIPFMHGAGKFWEVSQYLESKGFELLGINPIQFISIHGEKIIKGRRILNECDAIFALRRDIIKTLPISHCEALLGFYVTNEFYEEAYSLLNNDNKLQESLISKGLDVNAYLGDLRDYIFS